MGTRYPEHLLAREPAPPYDGQGTFGLWHFSEDPRSTVRQMAASTVGFSGSRLHNSGPHPDRIR